METSALQETLLLRRKATEIRSLRSSLSSRFSMVQIVTVTRSTLRKTMMNMARMRTSQKKQGNV